MKAAFVLAVAMLVWVGAAAQGTAAQPQAGALSDAQRKAMTGVLERSKPKAAELALTLAEKVKAVNAGLLAEKSDDAALKQRRREAGEAVGKLIELRIDTARDLARLLTPEQRAALAVEVAKPGADQDLVNVIVKRFGLEGS